MKKNIKYLIIGIIALSFIIIVFNILLFNETTIDMTPAIDARDLPPKLREEIGYKDGKTGYTLEFDCSNINDIVNKIKNIPKFNFKHLEDIYGDLFTNKPSDYKEENMKSKVKCTNGYYDIILKRMVEKGEEQIVDNDRAEYLIGLGLVELVERIEVKEPKEDKKLPTKKVTKR